MNILRKKGDAEEKRRNPPIQANIFRAHELLPVDGARGAAGHFRSAPFSTGMIGFVSGIGRRNGGVTGKGGGTENRWDDWPPPALAALLFSGGGAGASSRWQARLEHVQPLFKLFNCSQRLAGPWPAPRLERQNTITTTTKNSRIRPSIRLSCCRSLL